MPLAVTDNEHEGGLYITSRNCTLKQAGSTLQFPARTFWWEEWRPNSIPHILQESRISLAQAGIHGQQVLTDLEEKLQQNKSADEAHKFARKLFQKKVRTQLQQLEGYSPHYRIPAKWERW